jgi:RND family efflux transporter MFP subunit
MSRLGQRALIVVAAATCGASCSSPVNTAQAGSTIARPVSVARVTRHDLGRTLEVAAEFRPYQEIDLHAKVAGYLKAIYVDVGDEVKQGQLIAELEAPEMTHEAAQADAAYKRALVEVDKARADLQRSDAQERLRRTASERIAAVVKVRRNLVAQQDVDEVNGRLQDAEAQLASAKASVAVAEEQVQIAAAAKERTAALLTYLRITAPFSGTITRRLADPGAMIQAGTASNVQAMPVVQLSQVDHLRLVLPVPESVVPGIRLHAPVEVRVDALKRVFQGQISRFTGKLDSGTRTMETEVDLPNQDRAIKAGMFGTAAIVLEQRRDALTIPVQALSSRTPPIKLLVVDAKQRLEERQIVLGLETPDRIEVADGLREGELVIVGARGDLRAGMAVAPTVQASSGRDR